MLKFENKINKDSLSFKMASKIVKTADIYNPAVLKENKFNLPFLYHFRNIEHDIIIETVKNAFNPVMRNGAFDIIVLNGKNVGEVKINSNVDLSNLLNKLDVLKVIDKSFKGSNGKNCYRYELIFKLTL